MYSQQLGKESSKVKIGQQKLCKHKKSMQKNRAPKSRRTISNIHVARIPEGEERGNEATNNNLKG